MLKKPDIYLVLALSIGLGILGLQNTLAQEADGIVCSSGSPVDTYKCAYSTSAGFSVTCPASRPKQYLIYPSPQQEPTYVECKTEAALAAIGSTYECSRANGEKYSVNIGLYCGMGETPVSCPSGYSALGQACISQSASPSPMSPSPSPSPSPSSSSSSSILCVGGVPGALTEMNRTTCYSMVQSTTLGIRCDTSGFVMHRGSDGWDSCISSSNVSSSEKACTVANIAGNNVTLYASTCPGSSSSAPSSSSSSLSKCPRKVDPSNGNSNPDPIPSNSKAKFILLSHKWSCYSIPDQSGAACTPRISPRDGTKVDPCKFDEESIVCPAGDTAYRDGNNLRCAPFVSQGGQPETPATEPPTVEPQAVTPPTPATPETVAQANQIPVTPNRPQELTEESCKAYRKEVVENVLPQGLAYLNFGEKLPVQTGTKNTAALKQLSDDLKKGAAGYRSVLKLTKNFECKKEYIEKLDSAIEDLNTKHFGILRQDYAIINQENPEKNQLFGVRSDLDRIGALLGPIQKNPKKVDEFKELRNSYEELKKMYDEEISKDQNAFLEIEIAEFAQRVSALRKSLESKLNSKTQVSDAKKSPSSALKKSTLKKKSKKASAKKKSKKKAKSKTKTKPKSSKK